MDIFLEDFEVDDAVLAAYPAATVGGGYLLIFNLGDGKAVFWKGGLVFGGRLAFYIKDWIDRKFMRHFQR